MADQPAAPDNVTPEMFFEQLLPMGFAAQAGTQPAPAEMTLLYKITGPEGGDWHVTIANGQMTVKKGAAEAVITTTLSSDDLKDAVLGRNGAALGVIIPQQRPGRPDNSGRAKMLKGTMALELSRDGMDPYKVEMSFNGAPQPRTVMKMKLADYLAVQTGALNGQEAFMTGKMKVEGDMAFLMQIAALTA